MPTDRWHELERLFVEASAQPAEVRDAFLARACGDAALRQQAASLILAGEAAGDFLMRPALETFARQISFEGWSMRAGDRVGGYCLERRIGAGGMGEVWRARDVRLDRPVAIKFLLPHAGDGPIRVGAFQQEARAAGALDHPNVLTVHDVGEHGDAPYLVTECLVGGSLRTRLADGPLAIEEALSVAVQAARGLVAAHALGIVHRDLKPENLFVSAGGRVKILDFGLATLHNASPAATGGQVPALPVGTAGYMAPEQARGEAVDGRADIFALGVVLHEMLTGRRVRDTAAARRPETTSVLPDARTPGGVVLPRAFSAVLARCLADAPGDRFPTAEALLSALEAIAATRHRHQRAAALLRRPAVLISSAIVVCALALGLWQVQARSVRRDQARAAASTEARRLAAHGDTASAYVLLHGALAADPEDDDLRQLWLDVSAPARIETMPAGADIAVASYRAPGEWIHVGQTPLTKVRLPRGFTRVRVTKAGYETIDGAGNPPALTFRLDATGSVPSGMVRIPAGTSPVGSGSEPIPEFWIDRTEVSNRDFKAFVDAGGYRRPEFWVAPFVRDGRELPHDEAVAAFRDRSGRPGPSGWQAGTYPAGQDDLPVGGVSWYEAAAYAAFSGKRLPTVHHWFRAASFGRFADVLLVSNLHATGPLPTSRQAGLGPFGTYDMAGNVKEWSSTASGGTHFVLGGAWDEPRYTAADYDAREPFARAATIGIRLVRYDGPTSPSLAAPVSLDHVRRDGRTLQPVSDDIFEVFRRQYAYDRGPLQATVVTRERGRAWTREVVAYDAADGERVQSHLFTPLGTPGPWQTVVFFPAADAFALRSSRDLSLVWIEFLLQSGRAVLCPIFKGTYERPVTAEGPQARRELRIAWARDLGRALDYLGTRPDLDAERVAFYGVSAGADAGVILSAVEPRLKASILQGTGVWGDETPESDAFNYAPRVRIPTLMLNGRYDFAVPYETAQRPLFDLIGAPAQHKRHVVVEAGHALPQAYVAGHALAWLDRHLGPVQGRPMPLSRAAER